ncbi:MAG: hypothetical protein A2046_07440 [Bacteroidetes bacterium GWA2_30_7]|nr:MAG: hypothetical protein A2046_07440 [Bacteroidetes bacterium GWA2_30_7]
MIADKDTNIIYFSEILKTDSKFSKTCKQITDVLDKYNIIYNFLPNTKDIWARDYMPIQISENKFIEYRYDPDYLQGTQKGKRDLKTYPDIVCDKINLKTIKTDIILDGGNVVKSSNAIILTDKILEENKRTYHKTQLLDKLRELFEVDKVILIPWDEDERYGHADGMVRFINDQTVLLNWYIGLKNCKFKDKLLNTLKENRINYEILKLDVLNKNEKLNWAYINFLQTSEIIILPKFVITEDNQAFEDNQVLEQFKKYFPVYAKTGKIIQIDCTEIVKNDGALNCISWTTYKKK